MNAINDYAWTALNVNKTDFTEGIFTFNGCRIEIIKRQDPYKYKTSTGTIATMSARFWGTIIFPNGIEDVFIRERGGEIARRTGFNLKEERALYRLLGDRYVLPYLRD